MWSRLEKTSFLTSNEKRAAIGYAPLADATSLDGDPIEPPANPDTFADKFNPGHDGLGRFTTGDGQLPPAPLKHLVPRDPPQPGAYPACPNAIANSKRRTRNPT